MANGKWKKVVGVAASVAVLGTVLAGCGNANSTSNQSNGSASSTSGKPNVGGSITLAMQDAQQSIDPAIAYDTASDELVDSMYDRLETYNGTSNTLSPMAATKVDVSSDGLTYTYHIRKGMTFWNGDKVTAKSFADEIKRIDNKSLGSPGVSFIQGVIQGADAYYKGTASNISGVTTPDDYTLQIKLVKPEPFFREVMAMPFFSAVDQKWIDKVGNKSFGVDQPMGSGPFELQKATTTQVVLKKNPHYWKTDSNGTHYPYLSQVTFNIQKTTHLTALAYEKGTIAWLDPWSTTISSSDFPTFKASSTLSKQLSHITQNAIYYLALNNKVAPFDNKKVRQAVEYAIDKKRIIQVFNGRGLVANQPLPPGIPGYQKSLPSDVQYSYNPKKAKALLKSAGFKQGTKIQLETYDDTEEQKETEIVQNNLEAVGFNVSLKTVTWSQFLNDSYHGKMVICPTGWNEDFPDAYDFFMLFDSANIPSGGQENINDSNYSSKQMDSLINTMQYSTNQTTRNNSIAQAAHLAMQDAPWVPVYYPVVYYAVQPWVHNFQMNNNIEDFLYQVWVDPSHSSK